MNLREMLLRRSVWYALPQIFPPLIRLATLPILTRLLKPEGYGQVALWASVVTFAVVGIRWTDDVLLRWISSGSPSKERSDAVHDWARHVVQASGTVLALMAIAAAIFSQPIWLVVGIVVAFEAATNALQQYARATGRARSFAAGALVSSICVSPLAIVFVSVFGTTGFLIAWIIADTLSLIVLSLLLRDIAGHLSRGVHDRQRATEMRRYGLPFIAATGSWMLLLFLDRLFVQAFHGSRELGLYALAFSVANTALYGLFMLLGFTVYAEVVALFEADGRRAAVDFLRATMRTYYAIAIPVACSVAFFAKDVIGLLAPPSFERAARMVPLLAAGLLLQAILPFTTKPFILERTPRRIAWAAGIGVAANVVLNFALIPPYGGEGAAIATLISYVITLGVVELMTSRLRIGRVGLALTYALPVAAGSVVVFGATSSLLGGVGHLPRLAAALVLGLAIPGALIVLQRLGGTSYPQRDPSSA